LDVYNGPIACFSGNSVFKKHNCNAMAQFTLTPEQIRKYHSDGYIIARGLFSQPETDKFYHLATGDDVVSKNSYNMVDRNGKNSKLALWFTPGNDTFGLMSRSESLVKAVDALLDNPTSAVCHFHSKLMQKEPKIGGAWEWHQDYGYWYKNEFLFPEQMISVMVAITDANMENGCLQVIKGSHKMGRVEHGVAGQQNGAAQKYVDLALEKMELVYVELTAGDVLFFHSNLLHRSDANTSERSRWSIISCYNRQSNGAANLASASCITPVVVVNDNAVLTTESTGLAEGLHFLSAETDKSLQEN
jgi:phytanoyl-CoA hydroxylase